MSKKKNIKNVCIGLGLILALTFSTSAQIKTRKAAKRNTVKQTTTPETPPIEDTKTETSVKKNARPEANDAQTSTDQNAPTTKTSQHPVKEENKPVYFYEFSQPDFSVSQVFIEHDDNGKGKITFRKKDFGEPVSDPIQLSPTSLERVKTAWQTLNFLDSTENYQYEKDYSHLGNMKFTMRKDGRERTAKFNYTTNKDAKTLADEYRKIEQQYIWFFDINIARENQPLETPGLMDALDSLIRRNEISDPTQISPFLKELSNDERLPLIARNHATRLIKTIEKQAEKKKDEK